VKSKFNAYEKTLYGFINTIYVVCPKCNRQAMVRSKGSFPNFKENETKLICTHCGFNKYYAETPKDTWTSERSGIEYKTRNLIVGSNIDPYFRLPLWLQAETPDGLLWAYNYEHLTFIENHVKAELRNREKSLMYNRSLGSRLPKWMTSKKNRQEILRVIEKLKSK